MFLFNLIALYIPMRIFLFHPKSVKNTGLLSLDYIIDFFLLLDITLELNCSYIDLEGQVIESRKKIFIRYLEFWLFIDIASIFPFELFNINEANSKFSIYFYNDLVKLFRLPKLYSRIKVGTKIIDSLKIKGSTLRLFKFLFSVIICLHIMACFWYYTG